MARHDLPALVRQFLRFLLGSCLGLAVDLALFETGVRLGLTPGLANVASSACAVVVVFLFVTKYAFRAERTTTSFFLFVCWYALSIAFFSVFIQVLHDSSGWAPFVCKLVSLPLSFGANFVFSRFLFRPRGGAAPPVPVQARQDLDG
ncbi:GtrA family protein [Blastococcus sp. TF02-8]|uniref:GtrA family protein n=1 Tax=Blastococcus sp. TF02-8 TaxID=2250574 RepID=UPI0014130E61|nr:GtrA family protein [Blastococcus sp. TF02-8]